MYHHTVVNTAATEQQSAVLCVNNCKQRAECVSKICLCKSPDVPRPEHSSQSLIAVHRRSVDQ
jgi:hypothetical protein